MKTCPRCGIKGEKHFHNDKSRADGKHHICKSCRKKETARYNHQNRDKVNRTNREAYRRLSPARRIVRNAKTSDQKRGFVLCTLTPEAVEKLIADGCVYCGSTLLQMTLDRVDNDVGHTRPNVKAACIRCNYLRRDMPFEAWEALVPAVRKATEAGLFGKWTGRTRKQK